MAERVPEKKAKKAKKLGCCLRFEKKGKDPCSDCPLMKELSKKARKKLLARHR